MSEKMFKKGLPMTNINMSHITSFFLELFKFINSSPAA